MQIENVSARILSAVQHSNELLSKSQFESDFIIFKVFHEMTQIMGLSGSTSEINIFMESAGNVKHSLRSFSMYFDEEITIS